MEQLLISLTFKPNKNQKKESSIMKLIVFEGLDGSGKTSLINSLQPHLKIPHQFYQGLGVVLLEGKLEIYF